MSVINVSARATVLDRLTGYSGPGVPARFADASGLPLVGATSGASGAFVNLNPGFYAMRFEAPGSMCTAGVGMLGSTTGLGGGGAVFYVDVRGGYELAPIAVNCFVR
jgi:hypothetical protein